MPKYPDGPVLTLDLGNSRLKATYFVGGERRARFELAVGDVRRSLPARLAGLSPLPRVAALSCVAAVERAEELDDLVRVALGFPLLVHPEPGLRLEVRSPETVGLDRLYAARGALERLGRSAVVVDAGTALTVDALRVDAGGAGVFLGGAIAPGPELCAEALVRRGARLTRIEPTPGVPALGRDTRSALLAGVVVGFEGAARHLVERVADEAGLGRAPVVLTGGARAFLEGPLAALGREVVVEEILVELGLLSAAGDAT